MIGRTLGSYTILEPIGSGGMGEVYLAKHRRIERKVAIKLLLPALSRDADIVSRFFNEARATSLITHPGIVQIIDCDVFEDRAYIVMEYLEGANLNAALQQTGTFEIPMALWITGQIASALAAAHAKGIVHRDLKPENVFLAKDPLRPGATVVKILDFGIAKLSDRTGPSSHTRTGSILGTPIYMSPEQCRGISSIDHRADIYALGGILFELLTGRPPFVKEAPGDLLIAHVSEAPPAPSSLNPAVPPELDRLVLRMLAKAPGDRPPSMDAVTQDLVNLHGAAANPGGPALTMKFDAPSGPPSQSQSPSAGGTRLLPENERPKDARRSHGKGASTLGMSAAEVVTDLRPRRRTGTWLALGGLAAAAVAVAVLRPNRLLQHGTDRTPVAVTPPPAVEPPPLKPASHASVDVPVAAEPAQPATITVQVASQPAGASVWIGDAAEPRGKTPLRVVVPRGAAPVQATLKADGYLPRTVSFGADRDQSLEVALQAAEAPHHASSHGSSPHGAHHASHGTASHPTETATPAGDTPKPPPKTEAQKKYFMMGD